MLTIWTESKEKYYLTGSEIINKRTIGSKKEELAAEYLKAKGYQIICRNFRARNGEIDIIASHDGVIIFAEVKYRKNTLYGYPGEAVNYNKRQSIKNTALYYIYKNNISPDTDYRFDVISILGEDITHVFNAF